MGHYQELFSRIKDFYRFSKQELSGLIIAILVTALIFSFKDWGTDVFDAAIGFRNLFLVTIIALISFWFRISCQKIYAVNEGYKAEFKVWWAGLVGALLIAFLSFGNIPLVIIGGMVTSFMVKQRLGEFRYGHSMGNEAFIGMWGIFGNLILAILFSIGLLAVPESYFFSKGLQLNMIMAFTSLLPFPQLDGLKIFYARRWLYYTALATVVLAAVLLLTGTKAGIIIAIVLGSIAGAIYIITGSDK